MTLGMGTPLRNARLDAITTFAGAGALLRIYDGTRPATGAAIGAQVLLAELVCGSPFAPASAANVLTMNGITTDLIANATGTATWCRVMKADGTTFVMDGSVGTAGADINFDSVAFQAGADIAVSSWTITEANA